MRVNSFVFNSYCHPSRYAICLAIIYCSFLTTAFFSNQEDFLSTALESEFYIGDEDMDDSPVRYLEIVGFQQAKLRCGVKYFPNRLVAASHGTLLKIISVKISPQKIFTALKPSPRGDAIVLYGVFRI